jgi:hypothetical protein
VETSSPSNAGETGGPGLLSRAHTQLHLRRQSVAAAAATHTRHYHVLLDVDDVMLMMRCETHCTVQYIIRNR